MLAHSQAVVPGTGLQRQVTRHSAKVGATPGAHRRPTWVFPAGSRARRPRPSRVVQSRSIPMPPWFGVRRRLGGSPNSEALTGAPRGRTVPVTSLGPLPNGLRGGGGGTSQINNRTRNVNPKPNDKNEKREHHEGLHENHEPNSFLISLLEPSQR